MGHGWPGELIDGAPAEGAMPGCGEGEPGVTAFPASGLEDLPPPKLERHVDLPGSGVELYGTAGDTGDGLAPSGGVGNRAQD